MHTGLSPNQWITEIRLQKARRFLLEDNHISKKDLAHSVGLKNITHFKELYRRRFGISL